MLRHWAAARKAAWHGAMEATLFSAWIYDTLKPYASSFVWRHPAKMKAICRRQEQRAITIDARTIADLVRCNLCRPAMWPRRGLANCAACCAIAAWW